MIRFGAPRAEQCEGGRRRRSKGNDFFQDPAPAPTFTTVPVRGPGLA
ncbi:hypothetical protein [Streptomyces sp. IBSBF 2806]